MVKEIIDQNGYIDKFIGDAIMAVFRGQFHLDRAIDACLAVRNKVEYLKEKSASGLPHELDVSIGINSGELISGNIGSAKLRRLDYTVIGDVVNTAQRLQGVAKAGQILIAQPAFEKVKESFNCNPIGEINLKHKAKPVMVYEVLA
jgi:class 3 adenylate cyclase